MDTRDQEPAFRALVIFRPTLGAHFQMPRLLNEGERALHPCIDNSREIRAFTYGAYFFVAFRFCGNIHQSPLRVYYRSLTRLLIMLALLYSDLVIPS